MIQLPSKIRTTLFNAGIEVEPYQLFSHEEDRLFCLIFLSNQAPGYPSFGRSGADVANSNAIYSAYSTPLQFYGPEPIWMGFSRNAGTFAGGFVLVHGVYRA